MASRERWDRWYQDYLRARESVIASKCAEMTAKHPEIDVDRCADMMRRHLYFFSVPTTDPVHQFEEADPHDIAWLKDALRDPERLKFVAALAYEAKEAPDTLLESFLLAAIDHDDDASFKKFLIRPCSRLGGEWITTFYIDQFQSSTGRRRMSVMGCLYFAGWIRPHSMEGGTDANARVLTTLARALRTERNVDVRRDIVRTMPFFITHTERSWSIPAYLVALLHDTLALMKHDPDEEIRQNIAVASALESPTGRRRGDV